MSSATHGNSYVVKRDGTHQPVSFDKILDRIRPLMEISPQISAENVDIVPIAQKVVTGIFPGVKTSELDNLAAETAAYNCTLHPDYGRLAARIAISNLQKETPRTFSEAMTLMQEHVNPKTGKVAPMISKEVFQIVQNHKELLDSRICHDRDFQYDYFGFKTLQRAYLIKLNKKIVETPQYMLMRVAIGIHKEDIEAALLSYDLMSSGFFTHATPTLFNAGTPTPQMSSCFLLSMIEDSIDGIYDTVKRCAVISKYAGGIGVSISNIRAKGSHINGTNGDANGIIPMLKVFNDTARFVDQGGGKRKGSFAMYLEPWHADVFEFLELKKNTGKEEERARDLFLALWTPDLFMQRVKDNGKWSLFCPNEAPGLELVYGEEFNALYEKYESQAGLARRVIFARELWWKILDSQMETGVPYMLYKDSVNRKSNQKNLGVIKSSNLCTEIMEYTDSDEVAVCNLASIALPKFVQRGIFNFPHLVDVVRIVVRNLNKIIDQNYYPIPEAKKSNLRHRPIAIGVQGLADTFMIMRLPYESEGAHKLNKQIFETIYYAACLESNALAISYGHYDSFPGSPASEGKLQFDLWKGVDAFNYNWNTLKEKIVKHGLRNSLLVGPMPTASTSQILGNSESFDPVLSNIFTRRVLAGEFPVVNKYLVAELIKAGLWNEEIKNQIIADNGSIQNIPEIPKELKLIYKTAWEISMKSVIDMAADRGAFIDQSQSMNLYMGHPTQEKLTSMHFYAWEKGLKTGMYYLRTLPAVDPIKITVDKGKLVNKRKAEEDEEQEGASCKMEPGCIGCGS